MAQPSSEFYQPARNRPLAVIEDVPERAMVVCAHPDDAEIGVGGAVAKWAAAGCDIVYVVCTSGSAGSNDPRARSREVVPARQREQRAAAAVLGVREVIFLDHPDGGLEDDRAFRGELVGAIRTHRPHTVFCHDPHRIRGFQHRDHRVVGMVTADAIYPYARDHLHFAEQIEDGLEPHKVRRLLMWGADEPDVVVDVTGYVDRQIEALGKHLSQVGGLTGDVGFDERLRARARLAGAHNGFEQGETFRQLIARA